MEIFYLSTVVRDLCAIYGSVIFPSYVNYLPRNAYTLYRELSR